MQRGYFITLEGLDGSGKTTQMKRLAGWLEKHDRSALRQGATLPDTAADSGTSRNVVLMRQPGGTGIGDRIRTLVLDSRTTVIAPMAEMALMFADRAQAVAEVIRPALNAGKIVICDRFTDSTEAYQGGGRQLGSEIVLELHRILCGNLQPDLTLLLLPSLEISLERARRRNDCVAATNGQDEGRFEAEQDAFYSRVWQKYREIARREPERVVAIEGNLSIDEVHEQIIEAVSERMIAARMKS
jgi:dTMP kinase